jgi:UbiD family decarboxylase
LHGRPNRIVRYHGTPVPADAECVVVGELGDEIALPQPVSTVLGTYDVPRNAFLLRRPVILRRTDPILFIPDSAGLLALATEILIWSHVQNIEGGLDVLDVRCFPCTAALVAVVKLRPRVQGQAKTALLGSLSGAAYWLKLAIGVDEDIDAACARDVFWSIASRTNAAVDVGMLEGVRMSSTDPSGTATKGGAERIGTRWFIDSTMPGVSQPEQRAVFQRAIPKNLARVDLEGHLRDSRMRRPSKLRERA